MAAVDGFSGSPAMEVHLARVQRRRFRHHDWSDIGALRIAIWRAAAAYSNRRKTETGLVAQASACGFVLTPRQRINQAKPS